MEHGGVLINSGCGLLCAEDSRSRFSAIGTGHPRGATPLAGDELFTNSLGGSLFNLFPSGHSRDGHPNAINTDSRDCHSLLNSSNSRSDSNSDVQILPPTAGQVEERERDAREKSNILPEDSASQAAPAKVAAPVPLVRKKVSERIAANNEAAAKDASKDGGKENGRGPRHSPENERRLQGTWSADENISFFNALRAHGRSFDKIHEEMGATKTREQVRCYYYRVIKKINQMIAFTGSKIDKGTNSEGHGVIDAILCWWDVMKKGTTEDTSVNLFRNSANLGDDERMAFTKKLWSKSSSKPIKSTESGKEGKDDRKAAGSVVQRIEFDTAGGKVHQSRKEDPTHTVHGKHAGKVDAKVDSRHSSIDRTPKRDVAGKGRPAHTPPSSAVVGETPLRDERVLIQSPKGHSQSEGSLHDSPGSHNGMSPVSFQLPAEGEVGSDTPEKLKLRLVARNPELGSQIKMCGFNPQLELTFKPTKAIGSIAAHLGEKWGAKLSLLHSERGVKSEIDKDAPVFRLYMAREGDPHPGWGPDDKSVQASQVHSFMGNPARFNLFYALDTSGPAREPARADFRSTPSALKPGKLISGLEPDTSSSSSNDFVPFQRHLARMDTYQGAASGSDKGSGRSSVEPARNQVPGGIDFSDVAKSQSKMGGTGSVPWTEDDVIFSSMLASRDGMGYTHSNMGSLAYPGDSLDGLNVLLNPDESSFGAALHAESSKQAPDPAPAPAAVSTAAAPAAVPAAGTVPAPSASACPPDSAAAPAPEAAPAPDLQERDEVPSTAEGAEQSVGQKRQGAETAPDAADEPLSKVAKQA